MSTIDPSMKLLMHPEIAEKLNLFEQESRDFDAYRKFREEQMKILSTLTWSEVYEWLKEECDKKFLFRYSVPGQISCKKIPRERCRFFLAEDLKKETSDLQIFLRTFKRMMKLTEFVDEKDTIQEYMDHLVPLQLTLTQSIPMSVRVRFRLWTTPMRDALVDHLEKHKSARHLIRGPVLSLVRLCLREMYHDNLTFGFFLFESITKSTFFCNPILFGKCEGETDGCYCGMPLPKRETMELWTDPLVESEEKRLQTETPNELLRNTMGEILRVSFRFEHREVFNSLLETCKDFEKKQSVVCFDMKKIQRDSQETYEVSKTIVTDKESSKKNSTSDLIFLAKFPYQTEYQLKEWRKN